MFTGGFEFKRVEIEQRAYTPRKSGMVYIQLGKDGKGKRTVISTDIFRKSGFELGDKVDLLQCGKMFALQKNSAGLLTITKTGSSGCIASQNLCRHLRAETKGCNEYEAWIESGMIVFRPKEEHCTL